ncbi:MAG TPA: hypothetical protein VLW85_07530 [Myxococcales bacterium]|nr:hypothetical protein [Myxococcales bacterium]
MSRPLIVATPLDEPEDGLVRVAWPLTIARLAVSPEQHPWSARWRLRRRGALVVAGLSVALLLLFAASGCASAPMESLRGSTMAPAPSRGLRCESLLVSRELQVPPEGELSDLRLTIDGLPAVLGKLRVLVRRPRFDAQLELDADQKPEFDQVLDVATGAGQRSLTVVLARPSHARDGWPRRDCKACRVDVELSGLFGAEDGLQQFFGRAMQEAGQVDAAFAKQSGEPASRPSADLRGMADELQAQARRCGVSLEQPLHAALSAIAVLDFARAHLYAGAPELPDAAMVKNAWELAGSAFEQMPAVSAAALAAGWPSSLRAGSSARMRASAAALDLAAQLSNLPSADKPLAAQWVTVALAQTPAALEKRIAALPPVKDIDDAEARLDWVDPRPGAKLAVPGLSQSARLTVRDWAAIRSGRRCIGPLGAAPVRDAEADAARVATFFGADPRGHVRVAQPADITAARETLQRASGLLCTQPAADVDDLFRGLEERELGPVADRLDEIWREVDPRRENDELARAVLSRTSRLLCSLFDEGTIERRVGSVVGYKVFVEGGTHLLEYLPGSLVCGNHLLPAREVRRRLRAAYREALEQHAQRDRLCPLRGGKCPDEVAASVRRLFNLARPTLAAPAAPDSRALDFPPPFGFGKEWVDKLDRCARDACEALWKLQGEAPDGQFEGALCPVRMPGDDQPTEVTLSSPEAPSSITLSSCDAHLGVRITLRRSALAGTLVSIASNHQFRYGSESVDHQARHPQLGRIYERVADLADPGDVSRRSDGIYEVALTPTVANQVFYFFPLRRRDY